MRYGVQLVPEEADEGGAAPVEVEGADADGQEMAARHVIVVNLVVVPDQLEVFAPDTHEAGAVGLQHIPEVGVVFADVLAVGEPRVDELP